MILNAYSQNKYQTQENCESFKVKTNYLRYHEFSIFKHIVKKIKYIENTRGNRIV